MKLNIGCGRQKIDGYINCDISKEVNPDVLVDLERTLPFEDNSINEILLNRVLEHTIKPIDIFKELYRVCKDRAVIKIRVPYFSSESTFSQIDHYSFYSITTFDCLSSLNENHWQGVGDFRVIYKKLRWKRILLPFQWLFTLNNKMTRLYQEFLCWIIPARELEVFLEVRK